MENKFKPGDRVTVVRGGWGVHIKEKGKIVTIESAGQGYSGEPGYIIVEKDIDSNCQSGICGGVVGESSFELYQEAPSEALLNY